MPGALERPQRIGFLPPVLETKGLGDKLGIDQAAHARLDGEVLFSPRRPLVLDSQTHLVNPPFPVGGVGSEGEGGMPEIGQRGGQFLKPLAHFEIPRHRARGG